MDEMVWFVFGVFGLIGEFVFWFIKVFFGMCVVIEYV